MEHLHAVYTRFFEARCVLFLLHRVYWNFTWEIFTVRNKFDSILIFTTIKQMLHYWFFAIFWENISLYYQCYFTKFNVPVTYYRNYCWINCQNSIFIMNIFLCICHLIKQSFSNHFEQGKVFFFISCDCRNVGITFFSCTVSKKGEKLLMTEGKEFVLA